jgi:hypothetical protein
VKLVERVTEILGNRDGYNGQLQCWKLGHRVIEFAGCDHEDDPQRFKGDPHDLSVRWPGRLNIFRALRGKKWVRARA